MYLEDRYLENTTDRFPDRRHTDYELKSWWCEFVQREREALARADRKASGGWLRRLVRRLRGGGTHGQTANDTKRPVGEAPGGSALLGIQGRADPSGPFSIVFDDPAIGLLDDLLLANGHVVVKVKKEGVRLAATSGEARQGQPREGGA